MRRTTALDETIPFALSPFVFVRPELVGGQTGSGQVLSRALFREVSDLLMKRLRNIIASLYGANKAWKRFKPDLKSEFGSNPTGHSVGTISKTS
ncbi:hypothetical protein C8R21_10246 [Nitrosospira multiformis]|uniref:Uncharacterized protein n=1 Tax=Nitrosospira multiformis TaxID=1231 RepID=A0A2T5IGT5_9PROT|nr:hypothetical protein C8R21_10246 [Nitrosospira multiformis]